MKKYVMKLGILLFAVLGGLSCATNEVSNENIQPRNEIPMYGSEPFPDYLVEANEKFITRSIESAGTREAAYEHFKNRGWEYFSKGDHSTAMKRFNQAWLLDRDRYESYWGFALLAASKQDYEQAVKMFTLAYRKNDQNHRLLVDIGLCYTNYALETTDHLTAKSYLATSIGFYKKAAALDDSFIALYHNWSVTLSAMFDFTGSWKMIKKAIKLSREQNGGYEKYLIESGYLDELLIYIKNEDTSEVYDNLIAEIEETGLVIRVP